MMGVWGTYMTDDVETTLDRPRLNHRATTFFNSNSAARHRAAHPGGGGEAFDAAANSTSLILNSEQSPEAELLFLLAIDVASQAKRRQS